MNKNETNDRLEEREGAIENMSLWDIANMEAGTDIEEPEATDDTPYKNYGHYTMIAPDDDMVDTSSS